MSDLNFPGDLIWVDTETTGIDPHRCSLLELSVRHTRGDRVLDRMHRVVAHGDLGSLHWDEYARDMHRRNGLIQEIADGHAEPADKVQEDLIMFLASAKEASGGESLWLAGCGPGFDRAFLRAFSPDALELLHYRNFDLNGLIRWYGVEKPEGSNRPHRSEADLDQDWELFVRLLDQRRAA